MSSLVNSYMASIGSPTCVFHAMQMSTTGREKIRKMRRECVCVYKICKEAQGRKNGNNMITESVAASQVTFLTLHLNNC